MRLQMQQVLQGGLQKLEQHPTHDEEVPDAVQVASLMTSAQKLLQLKEAGNKYAVWTLAWTQCSPLLDLAVAHVRHDHVIWILARSQCMLLLIVAVILHSAARPLLGCSAWRSSFLQSLAVDLHILAPHLEWCKTLLQAGFMRCRLSVLPSVLPDIDRC